MCDRVYVFTLRIDHFKIKIYNFAVCTTLKIFFYFYTERNSFAEGFKNLARYRSENIFVIDLQNNYMESVDDNTARSFNILTV